jgi:polyferredoxin
MKSAAIQQFDGAGAGVPAAEDVESGWRTAVCGAFVATAAIVNGAQQVQVLAGVRDRIAQLTELGAVGWSVADWAFAAGALIYTALLAWAVVAGLRFVVTFVMTAFFCGAPTRFLAVKARKAMPSERYAFSRAIVLAAIAGFVIHAALPAVAGMADGDRAPAAAAEGLS